jgi:hypothetical protein
MDPRDIAIRTILGEAASESPTGQAAVAHVLLNRARDPRWPSAVQDVALQNKQFSAWNSGAGGNHLVNKYKPGDAAYERVGAIYDQVASGAISDPTGGATHYYSPAGMQKLVNDGDQSNVLPRWLQQQHAQRDIAPTTIGGHIFTGQASGTAAQTQQPMGFGALGPAATQPAQQPMRYGATMPPATPEAQPMGLVEALAGIGATMQQQVQQPPAPQALMAPQAQAYQPVRRDTTRPYLDFFQTMRG